MVALGACGRIGFDPVRDAGQPPIAWGEFAAGLPVPDCTGSELVVTDTTSTLDGGMTITDPSQAGSTLSYVEAMWIAANRSGSNVIRFDPVVFPVDVPAMIAIATGVPLPSSLQQVCIDGRHRGVIVDWSACGPAIGNCPPPMISSMLVGMTFLGTQYELSISGTQMAGTRINTDGLSTVGGLRWSVEIGADPTHPTVLGPGNVIANMNYTIRVLAGQGDISIVNNGIGYDLVTHQVVGSGIALDFQGGGSVPVSITDNIIAAQLVDDTAFTAPRVELARNQIGVDSAGNSLGSGLGGLSISQGTFVLGPDNDLRGLTSAAVSVSGGSVTITRNRISGNASGIVYSSSPPVLAPVITQASPSSIAGTCTSGTVEVFADPGDQGAQFLASAPCGSGSFTVAGSFPMARNATATETVAAGTSAFSTPVAIQ